MSESRDLETEERLEAALARHAEAIREIGRKTIANIIEIGRHLTHAKAIAGHGNWLPWLEIEFSWTDRTARNYMGIYEMMAKSETFSDLAITVSELYKLKKVPSHLRDPILDRLRGGEKLTPAEVAKFVRPISQPDEPPREVTVSLSLEPSPRPASEPWNGTSLKAQVLRSSLLDIERMLGDIGEIAETLIEHDATISRALFRKIGSALSAVGNTVHGEPAKTAKELADKYIKPSRKHLK
jgi:hypothetical protein